MLNKIKHFFLVLIAFSLVACGGVDMPKLVSPPAAEPLPNVAEIVRDSDNHTTLYSALQAVNLDTELADADALTLFAPTDEAFEKLGQATIDGLLADTDQLTNILTYHAIGSAVDEAGAVNAAGTKVEMLNGQNIGVSLVDGKLYINNAMVTVSDIEASNGVVHVIDTVLIPPTEMMTSSQSIVDIAVSDANFSTLVTALQAANLVDTLADEMATFTVFAPTNDAFAKIPSETLTAILADTDTLTAILLQHVIADAAVDSISAYTLNGKMATMASDAMLDIKVVDGMLTIGGAGVTVADIYASNGVIHVIDTVIVGDVTLP